MLNEDGRSDGLYLQLLLLFAPLLLGVGDQGEDGSRPVLFLLHAFGGRLLTRCPLGKD